MLIDQTLRRLVWRARRWISPAADNDPIITVERGPAPAEPPRAALRPRRRLGRSVVAFLATLAALGGAYGALVALNSRVGIEAAAPAAEPGESRAIAAVALVLAGADDPNAAAGEWPFIPSMRRLREARLREGALRVAEAYIARAAPPSGRLDAALADARAAMAAPAGADRIAARDALVRFNDRLARGQAKLDGGHAALAGLLAAAADSCEAEAVALAAFSAEPTLLAAPRVDARVAQARGVAWAWGLVLQGALADAPEIADALTLESTIPMDALGRIAAREPLFLFNAAPQTPWAPAHVAEMAGEFARAAAGARALGAAVSARAAADTGPDG